VTASGADVALCIPTLDPGPWVERMLTALRTQSLEPRDLIVIDSDSTDGSPARWAEAGASVISIRRDDFDHGGTRNLALQHTTASVVVFLTQDAIPADDLALEALTAGLLACPEAGAAYGRQLPHPDAGPLARAHRAFNYPADPAYRTSDDVPALGVRAAFCSNAFAAYRRAALEAIGGFPDPIIGSEDRWAAARLLQAGWGIAYVPGARVEHSHDDSYAQNVRRYFDIGVFQSSERWFEDYLGRPDREGGKLVRAQIAAMKAAGVAAPVPRTLAHAAACWFGFRLGRLHRLLPRPLAARLSTAPAYFRTRKSRPR
jgi:rhamnosyltransferase